MSIVLCSAYAVIFNRVVSTMEGFNATATHSSAYKTIAVQPVTGIKTID